MDPQYKRNLLYRLINAPIRPYPFPHCYLENVFDDEWYEKILADFPANETCAALNERTTKYGAKRYNVRLNDEKVAAFPDPIQKTWRDVMNFIHGSEFVVTMFQKFEPIVRQSLKVDLGKQYKEQFKLTSSSIVVRDKTNYSLNPHTDARHKLITTLFYFAEDDSQKHLGTSLYLPKERSYYHPNSPHLQREKFECAYTLDYKPNAALIFPVSGRSFHGVEPIRDENPQRLLLQHQIMHES